MFTKARLAIGACLSLALVSGVALAEGNGDHHGRHGAMIEKFDTNKDGKLDDAEKAKMKDARKAMRAGAKAKRLAQFDANKNGKIDDAEKATMRAQRKAEMFKKLDANNDGKITQDEFNAPRAGGHKHGHR